MKKILLGLVLLLAVPLSVCAQSSMTDSQVAGTTRICPRIFAGANRHSSDAKRRRHLANQKGETHL